jgi:hypothetical protein
MTGPVALVVDLGSSMVGTWGRAELLTCKKQNYLQAKEPGRKRGQDTQIL